MMPNSVTISEQLFNDSDRVRLQAFAARYPDPAYLWLACHAAFPVALTNDLLYKIWLNFRQNEDRITFDLPLNAVSELLFSPLCEGIGYNLYEIPLTLRTVLWQSLSRERIALLAEFLLQYLNFCRDKVPSDAFAEAQRIWANTIRSPDEVAKLLLQLTANRATNTRDRIMAEYVLNWVKSSEVTTNEGTEITPPRTDNLSQAVSLLEGIRQYESGRITAAQATFSSISHLLKPPQAGGFNIPIPKEIWQNLPINAPVEQPKGKIYAVLVGIDEYGDGMLSKEFKGCVNDVYFWQTLLKEHYTTIEIVSLLDAQATKEAILQALGNAMSILKPDDTLFFTFSGHAHNKDFPHALAAYDTVAAQRETYLSETEFKSIITSLNTFNPFVTVILDTHGGSSGWIDANNEKHILLSATADGEISVEVDKKGLFTSTLQSILNENNLRPVTYQKLIRESFRKIKKANYKQTPQLFGHYNATTLTFLESSPYYDTYWNELLTICGYPNYESTTAKVSVQDIANEFGLGRSVGIINLTLEKYALLKGAEKLKVVRISSEMSVRQIPVFQREYLKSLPYEVDIKDISLFYSPSRAGLKDGLAADADVEDNLSSLQDAHIIVFVLNRALVSDFSRHSSIAPVINHLKRFEYKVVCSILWEDCDWQRTVLKDYDVFSKNEPLERSLSGFKTELEIKRYYEHDWQPVINKWITDLASLGFEKELKERLEKAKQTQELDLSGMAFEKLPEAVWELKDLKTIDLYNNKLTELPESLTQFQSLEKLYASKNPITALPLFLSDLPNLRVLKIDDAQITEFPNWLCKHPALEDISLENNQIEIIPSALKDLPRLKLFDFRGNPVINLPQSILKATKGKLTEYIPVVRTNPPVFIDYHNEAVLLFLGHGDENGELNLIQSFFTINIEETSLSGRPFNNAFSMNIYTILTTNYESIFHFTVSKDKTLLVHLPQSDLSDDEIQKLAKLFLEYPTGTAFFLNFSNSKQLAELLYQQKHSPIIAYEGELDEETAVNAVRYFYTEYHESKNAISAFQYMLLKLPETSSKGLYILYRY